MVNLLMDNNVKKAKEIFDQYSDFIYTVFASKLSDQETVNDLYQDFFVKLASKPLPGTITSIKSYLYKSIVNSIYDHLRKRKAHKEKFENYQGNLKNDINISSKTSVLVSKSEELFEKGVKLLSVSEQKVFTLRFKKGLKVKEIAEVTGLRKETVSRYLTISLNKIRDMLEIQKNARMK